MPIEYQNLKAEGATWGSVPNPSVIKTRLLESGGNTTCKRVTAVPNHNVQEGESNPIYYQ